jgi:hypothetical protein
MRAVGQDVMQMSPNALAIVFVGLTGIYLSPRSNHPGSCVLVILALIEYLKF